MTKKEIIEALEMRINGATYREIGEKFNCSKQYIEQVLKYSINEKSIKNEVNFPYYRNLIEWICENGYTLSSLAEELGTTHQTLSNNLKKVTPFKINIINSILEISGLSYEYLFKED